MARPKTSGSLAEKELDKVQKQAEDFEQNLKDMTLDRMNMAPKQEVEQQTKISQKDIEKSTEIYLKPERSVSSRDKFNENYRKQYNFAQEFVQFIAENKTIIGEAIEIWTRPFAGMPAEFWRVPVNKPVWGPRHLAEQIKKACYHKFEMSNSIMGQSSTVGQFYGGMVVDTTVQRLDAIPVSGNKSIFMGALA